MSHSQSGSGTSSATSAELSRPRRPGSRTSIAILLSVAIGVATILYVQSAAPAADFQTANLISIMVGLVTALFVTVQLHRLCRAHLHWLVMPAVVTGLVLVAILRYQWVGFSGEMFPQFRDRFAVAPQRQSVSVGDEIAGNENAVTDAGSFAQFDSPEFLGVHRNGVIPRRMFDVPPQGESPRELWRTGVGDGWSSFAVAGDRAVTLEQRETFECLTCYRLADGRMLWNARHETRHTNPIGGVGPRSTPTIVGDRVYAQGATGHVWCVDIGTGEEYWSADLLAIIGWTQQESENVAPWGRSASPLVVDGRCVLPLAAPDSGPSATRRSLIALDADNGMEVWRAGADQISYASPMLMTLAGKRQIVSVNECTVSGHEVETGQNLWTIRWPGQTNGGANCASAIQVDGDRFLIGKGYGGGSMLVRVARDDQTFSVDREWASSRVLKTKFTHPCVDGNIAYAISNGMLQATSIVDGGLIWSQTRRRRAGSGQILLVDDVIVVQREQGDVEFVSAEADDYVSLVVFDALSSKTWNIPTIAGRHLLVRNDREAICFLLPGRH